jgi:putative oxidoreductase
VNFLFLAGRILYGGFFLRAGIDHFRFVGMMTPYAASKGVPAPRIGVLGSGLLMVLGGLSIVAGDRPSLGLACITIALIPITILMHNFWGVTDPQGRQAETVNFKKNIALLGAAWMMLLIPQPWPMSLGW